jgi:hypothetical protein
MATFEKHCQESIILFGKAYEEVHRWLDEFQGREPYGMRHRRLRHHEAGIGQAGALFGPEVEAVARRHIMTDLKEEGWTEQDPFPRDEADFVKIGFF